MTEFHPASCVVSVTVGHEEEIIGDAVHQLFCLFSAKIKTRALFSYHVPELTLLLTFHFCRSHQSCLSVCL